MEDTVLLESGERVRIPVVHGDPCVFDKLKLEFASPSWIDDSAAGVCMNRSCQCKFSQIKRKHHCRSCGKIYCSKCCSDKLALPHLNLDQERVCVRCRPIQELILKSSNSDVLVRKEAASQFNDLIQQRKDLRELLELGGLQVLVWLCNTESSHVCQYLVTSLHTLTTQAPIQPYLIKSGVVKGVVKMLKFLNPNEKQVTDCITILLILSNKHADVVMSQGGVACLMPLISKVDEVSRLLILQVLVQICSYPASHSIIMYDSSITKYMASLCSKATDAQIVSLIMRIFCEVSSSSLPAYRIVFSQEEQATGYVSKVLYLGQTLEVLLNSTCLLANIAYEQEAQTYLPVNTMLEKFETLMSQPSAQCYVHIMRSLANLSQYTQHSRTLLRLVPTVVQNLNKNITKPAQQQTIRFLVNLLHQFCDETSEQIIKSDCKVFLTRLMQTQSISKVLVSTLDQHCAKIEKSNSSQ